MIIHVGMSHTPSIEVSNRQKLVLNVSRSRPHPSQLAALQHSPKSPKEEWPIIQASEPVLTAAHHLKQALL